MSGSRAATGGDGGKHSKNCATEWTGDARALSGTKSEIAGVKPGTKELNGEDPTAFILSANIHRRHMTKGQRAMAVAKIYPDPKRGAHSELNKSTGGLGFDKAYLSHARAVLQYAADLAANVLTGTGSLDHAYKTGLERKTAASFFVHRLCYSGLARGLDLRGGNTMDFWYLWHSMNVWSRYGVCFIAGACLLTLILVLLS